MGRELRALVDGGSYFEGPRWHDGRWWVSDFYRNAVYAIDPDGRAEQAVELGDVEPSGLGWLPDGSLLVVSKKDHRILRRSPDGELSVHADLSAYCGGDLNDMVVSADGNAYAGNFGFDLMGGADPAYTVLVHVAPGGETEVAADELGFPNGAVITPDGATLIVAETIAARFTAFTIADGGRLTDRRIWAQVAATPPLGPIAESLPLLKFSPDGITLDAEEHVWAADALGGRVARVAPGGEIVDEIRAPEGLGFFACMLGGEDGRTLLLAGAPDFAEENRRNAREAVLLTTTVEAPHAGLP
jgi:sugar lactone lactonase YvrE